MLWLLVIFGLVPFILADTPFAPADVLPLVKFGNKDYYFSFKFKTTFLQADQICRDLNMRLITIPNKEVNDFLYKTVSNEAETLYWTSGSNILDSITWIWMSTAQPVVYTNWQQGQPTQSNLKCILGQAVKSKNELLWNNADCNNVNNFICESVDVVSSVPEAPGNWAKLFVDPSVSPSLPLFNYNRYSYLFVTGFPVSFVDADRFCRMVDMELVSIDSELENTWLYRYMRNTNIGTSFWSGGTRVINGIDWIWIGTGRKVIYTNWQKGQPDNINDKCIQLMYVKDSGLFWNDYTCSFNMPFICKAPSEKFARCPVIDPACYESRGTKVDVIPQTRNAPVKPFYNYKILPNAVTYTEAIKACEAESMKLASIQNTEKSEGVTKILQESSVPSVYTSAKKSSNTWYWGTGEAFTFTNWNVGEPNNSQGIEDCVEAFKSGAGSSWNDISCSIQRHPLCEKLVVPDPEPCGCQASVVNVFYDKPF